MKIKKISITTIISVFLFILIFAIRSFTDAIYVSKGIDSNIWINSKYIVLIIAIIWGVFLLKNKKDKYIFSKEFASVWIVITIFILIILILIIYSNNFYTGTIEEFIKLILPIIYVFIVLNTFNFKEIYVSMSVTLILSLIGYVIEIGTSNFSLANILTMNFFSSYSPFESSMSCGIAIALFVFFVYYDKNKIFKYLSFIFVIFTFKRLFIVFAIVLLILSKFVDINKVVRNKYITIAKVFFIVATILYYIFLLPSSSHFFEKVVGNSQDEFTMGRSSFLRTLENSDFISSGLGSTTQVIGRGLEMDLIKIYLELGIIGLITFVLGYWNCAGNKVYTFIYMTFQFFNMLTSHSLTSSFDWILAFLIIGCISYKTNNQEFQKNKERVKIYEKCRNNNS